MSEPLDIAVFRHDDGTWAVACSDGEHPLQYPYPSVEDAVRDAIKHWRALHPERELALSVQALAGPPR